MTRNPVERNFVTRFLLGFAVIVLMFVGGGAVGHLLRLTGLQYGAWIGTAVGAVAVFVGFTVLYLRYDASFSSE